MTLTFLPFIDEHLAAAAQMLAARQRRDRLVLPQLPKRFEEPAAALEALESAWRKPWSSGAAALDSGVLVGYLFGTPQFDAHMGRTAWVRPAGYALANGIDVEVMRDLYAVAGAAWIEKGCFDHYVMISTADRALLDAWYSLDFGQQHAYGLLDLKHRPDSASDAQGILVRRANADDGHHLVELCYITGEHQFHAPTWAPTPQEIMAGRPQNYSSVASDDEAITWLAFKEGDGQSKALGFQIYYEAEPEADDLYVPESCIELPAAGTLADARGQGLGTALTNAGLSHAQSAGYAYCLTDWRTTNLQSSRFWPKKGFEPVVYRLHRSVDERIMWANKVR